MDTPSQRALWKHFDHDADVGIRGFGHSLEEAFEQAALAMVAVVTDPAGIGCGTDVPIRCQADDIELLLVDWLNAVLSEMSARKMVFGRFRVVFAADHKLEGVASGERVDRVKHKPAVEVKAASYLALKVRRRGGVWLAQCVVDV